MTDDKDKRVLDTIIEGLFQDKILNTQKTHHILGNYYIPDLNSYDEYIDHIKKLPD